MKISHLLNESADNESSQELYTALKRMGVRGAFKSPTHLRDNASDIRFNVGRGSGSYRPTEKQVFVAWFDGIAKDDAPTYDEKDLKKAGLTLDSFVKLLKSVGAKQDAKVTKYFS
jgi:hypothetical protein